MKFIELYPNKQVQPNKHIKLKLSKLLQSLFESNFFCLFVYFDSAHITCIQNNAWIYIKESMMTETGQNQTYHISHVYKNNSWT